MKRTLGLAAALSLCWASRAAAGVHAYSHPLVSALTSNTSLRQGVIREIRALHAGVELPPAKGDAQRVERLLAQGLLAHRDELPGGAAEEVLGGETTRLLRSIAMDPEKLAELKDGLWDDEPGEMERAVAYLANVYDRAVPGTADSFGTVVGRESRPRPLPASTRAVKADDKKPQ